MITATCPTCGARRDADGMDIGERFRCSECDGWVEVRDEPEPAETPEPVEPAPPLPQGRVTPEGEWLAEGVVDHQGMPISKDAEFFAHPPKEVGELQSASTTLARDKKPVPTMTRIVASLIFMAIFAGIGYGINAIFDVESFWAYVWQYGLALAGLLMMWFGTAFDHTCTFVGDRGVARFRCKNGRDLIIEEAVFRFDDASELRTGITAHYTNGVYEHTDFSFDWTDSSGARVYRLNGSHQSKKDTPPSGHIYYFGQAAELAWSQYLLGKAFAELKRNGSFFFRLGGNDYIEIGEGWIDFHLKGQSNRYSREELASADLSQGELKIKAVGAREGWFRSSGVFKFQYKEIANGRLFLLLFEHLSAPYR